MDHSSWTPTRLVPAVKLKKHRQAEDVADLAMLSRAEQRQGEYTPTPELEPTVGCTYLTAIPIQRTHPYFLCGR